MTLSLCVFSVACAQDSPARVSCKETDAIGLLTQYISRARQSPATPQNVTQHPLVIGGVRGPQIRSVQKAENALCFLNKHPTKSPDILLRKHKRWWKYDNDAQHVCTCAAARGVIHQIVSTVPLSIIRRQIDARPLRSRATSRATFPHLFEGNARRF